MENDLSYRVFSRDSIKVATPFKDLFDIEDSVLSAIKEDMEANGYDASKPIDLWKGKNIVLDGHTRLKAAAQANIDNVLVYEHEFDTEQEAIEYAIHNQRDRRNVTDAEILRCVEVLDKRKSEGRPQKTTPDGVVSGSTSKQTASVVGVSPRKVERTRTIIDHADEQTKQEVKSGKKSINKAYNETQEKRKQSTKPKSKPTFNATNDNIEWAKWTWNPVTGCKHGCKYCYARDIANRFYPEKFEPTFRPERLTAPSNTAIPKSRKDEPGINNVFVCSMADLFGEWVPQEWIDKVLLACRSAPQWNFIFLTKNPERYLEIEFPDNCWIGATADTQERMDRAIDVFFEMEANCNKPSVTFVSCEPLSEQIALFPMCRGGLTEPQSFLDWIIIGGRSQSSQLPAMQPEWEWVENLLLEAREGGIKVYFKPNLIVVPKEYP
jgi:protein gp37